VFERAFRSYALVENDRTAFARASACAAAGGVFLDNVFGWMVHVYPFETDVAKEF